MMPRFELLPDLEETVFLTLENVDLFHEEVLTPDNIRGYKQLSDLEGAIGRPQTAACYDPEVDLVRIAAYYWHGISTSHGYIDGNKRTGFSSAVNFLLMNGVVFTAPPLDLGMFIDQLFEEDRFDLEILEDILRKHSAWA